jgi:hypothetical protein
VFEVRLYPEFYCKLIIFHQLVFLISHFSQFNVIFDFFYHCLPCRLLLTIAISDNLQAAVAKNPSLSSDILLRVETMAGNSVPISTPVNLNPFYIEGNDWQQDGGDWQNDYGDVEEEGLLDQRISPDRRRRRRRPHPHSQRRSRLSARCIACFMFVFLLCYIFVSLHGESRSAREAAKGGGESYKQPSSHNVAESTQQSSSSTPHTTTYLESSTNATSNETSIAPSTSTSYSTILTQSTTDRDKSNQSNNSDTTATINLINTSNPSTIEEPLTLVLLGERLSGVEWMYERLHTCFPSLSIHSGVTRDAWLFQEPPPSGWFNNTASLSSLRFLVMVRDPYDWVQAMWHTPEYAPYHRNLSLLQFVNQTWTVDSSTTDIPLDPDTNATDASCHYHFHPGQIVPCHVNTTDRNVTPAYEMSSTGAPFANVLHVRAAKLHHVLDEIPLWYASSSVNYTSTSNSNHDPNMMVVPYEHDWSTQTLPALSKWLHLHVPASVEACPRTSIEKEVMEARPQPFITFMYVHVNWTLEERIGYKAIPL